MPRIEVTEPYVIDVHVIGVAILNADDPATHSLLPQIETPVVTFGMRASADINGTLLQRCASEQTFLIRAGQETATVTTPVIGDPHIAHCLAAASLALTPVPSRSLQSLPQVREGERERGGG